MEQEKNSNSGSRAIIILLAVLLVGSLIGNIYLYKARGTSEVAIVEKQGVIDSVKDASDAIELELEEVKEELTVSEGKNVKLDSVNAYYKNAFSQSQARVKALMSGNLSKEQKIAELAKELETVKALKEEYFDRIDQLEAENLELKSTLNVVSKSKDSLEGELKSAGALRIIEVEVKTFKIKSNGKPLETAKASRTEKFEACFSIMDNKVAKEGERTVYLRIMQPEGGVLGEQGTFTVKGKGIETGYTAMEIFNYTKSKKDFCLGFTDEKYDFKKGTYVVDIFIDGELHTSGYYDLK